MVELVGRLIGSHQQLAKLACNNCSHFLLVLRWARGKKAVVDDRAVQLLIRNSCIYCITLISKNFEETTYLLPNLSGGVPATCSYAASSSTRWTGR